MNTDFLRSDTGCYRRRDKRQQPQQPSSTPEAPEPPCPYIGREVTKDLICVLTFDNPDSSANIFDRTTLKELNDHLNFIRSTPELKGVILTSAKPSIFIAGADLKALADAVEHSPADLKAMIEFGQRTFSRLAALPIPTVAAIHGACLGGGFEVALACDWRIASPDKATKIGLPETHLGILPAWGGSTRLPRLIGLPAALDLILAGKSLAAPEALKRGLVDEVAPREYLVEFARRRILERGAQLKQRPGALKLRLTNNALAALAISLWLHPKLMGRTRGHYPAVLRALDMMGHGASRSVDASLALELDAVLKLAGTPACRNLVRVFFLQERAKKLAGHPVAPGPTTADSGRPRYESSAPVRRAAVIGAGVMGAGIAQWLAARGASVILRDIGPEQAGKGMATIGKLFAEGVKRHTFTKVEARAAMDRIFPAASSVPLAGTDLILEAAVEKLGLKQQLFRELDSLAGPNTILATNTSALPISEIAASTAHPERVIGIHFFNPVHRMQLVEVVHARQTSPDVIRRALRFVQQIGRLPVLVKDSPGFLVNRILMPYLIEAGHLFEAGARIQDIDEAMLDFGMPMGPLRLIDEVGVDVCKHVADTLVSHFADRLEMPPMLGLMLERGWLGRKSGHGFFVHEGRSASPNPAVNQFRLGDTARRLSREELQRRMVLLMVNEAVRCLEEQVVSEPEDVDFGMIMGTGFAPFRGGPLRYADATGLGRMVDEMNRLVDAGAKRYLPCPLLQNMAVFGGHFYEKGG
jgi:3-hydroxyacyl-CoA dehydrogenase/enoyl-CoA hydratase/3-hydroxybutyryl-CoA epimerase